MNFFNFEIQERQKMCKKLSTALDYIDKILIALSATSGS